MVLFAPLEIRSGVVVRLMTPVEMREWAYLVHESGLYREDIDAIQRRLDRWWRNPATWPLGVFWRGKPLQYEAYHLAPPKGTQISVHDDDWEDPTPGVVRVGFNSHVDRERPRWFYREAGRLAIERLAAAGYREMVAYVRSDRPDWIDYLVRTYGATNDGPVGTGLTSRVRYQLSSAIAAATGWPGRRSLGSGWQWTHPGSGLVVREMQPEELAETSAALAGLWGGESHPAVLLVRRLLAEHWELDDGTVLLARRGDALAGVFTSRLRREGVAQHAVLVRYGDGQDDVLWRVMGHAQLEWARQAGYRTVVMMLPDATYDHPTSRRVLANTGWVALKHHVHYRRPFVEIGYDLSRLDADALAIREEWRDGPPLPLASEVPA